MPLSDETQRDGTRCDAAWLGSARPDERCSAFPPNGSPQSGCQLSNGERATHAIGIAFGPGLAVDGLVFVRAQPMGPALTGAGVKVKGGVWCTVCDRRGSAWLSASPLPPCAGVSSRNRPCPAAALTTAAILYFRGLGAAFVFSFPPHRASPDLLNPWNDEQSHDGCGTCVAACKQQRRKALPPPPEMWAHRLTLAAKSACLRVSSRGSDDETAAVLVVVVVHFFPDFALLPASSLGRTTKNRGRPQHGEDDIDAYQQQQAHQPACVMVVALLLVALSSSGG